MSSKKKSPSKLTRALWTAAGTVFLCLGIIGIVLPLLPTTPFLLLAAACYLRGSKKMHDWLLNQKWFGKYIRNYQEGRGIPLKVKILAISFLWITITFSALFVIDFLWGKILLFIIAVAVSIHIIRIKTLK
ncbi:MAG: YbaN family protein [Methanomassiliicoccales archaeon]|nr:MAG: YbaN family protein [Methanomassiliicoccales archaeon]